MHTSDTKRDSGAAGALLDTAQAARFLGLGERTLENWRVRDTKGPPFLRVGRSVKYDPRDLDAWLNARRFRSTSDADHRTAA